MFVTVEQLRDKCVLNRLLTKTFAVIVKILTAKARFNFIFGL